MTPTDTVRHIYECFGKGDVPGILACMAEDIEWEYASFPNPVPWLQPRRGHEGVKAFFGALAEHVEFRSFQPTRILADGNFVVSFVDLEAVARSTGKAVIEVDEGHLWHFNAGGKVQRFRHRADTFQQAMALSAET